MPIPSIGQRTKIGQNGNGVTNNRPNNSHIAKPNERPQSAENQGFQPKHMR